MQVHQFKSQGFPGTVFTDILEIIFDQMDVLCLSQMTHGVIHQSKITLKILTHNIIILSKTVKVVFIFKISFVHILL